MTPRHGSFRLTSLWPLLVCAAVLFAWWWRCNGATTLLIVRHADRLGTQDALTPAGVARAQELAHVAEKGRVAAIYQSDTQRSRLTAGPLAAALSLTPVELPAADVSSLIHDVFEHHRGETVLIVGHSNTVSQIIAAAGGPAMPDLADDEFDNLFVVDVCRCGRNPVKVTNLQYGVTSP